MQNKKLATLIILIIVAVFVWLPKGRKRRLEKVMPNKLGNYNVVADLSAKESARPLLEAEGIIRKRSEFADWGRDPFIWPKEAETPISGLQLSGIVWDEQAPYAIINGAVLHTGDKVDGKTLKRIEQNKVILTDGRNDFVLGLD